MSLGEALDALELGPLEDKEARRARGLGEVGSLWIMHGDRGFVSCRQGCGRPRKLGTGSLTTIEGSTEFSVLVSSLDDPLLFQSGKEYDFVKILGLLVGVSGMRIHSESNLTIDSLLLRQR
jgi:hypothetical protein